MKFFATHILKKHQILDDTYIFRVTPKPFEFSAGQYVFLQNPDFKPSEPHPFSIASSPLRDDYLEFCIKTYGQWTQEFSGKKIGEIVNISKPRGNFIWDNRLQDVVFLLGGIGISPIMSILQTLSLEHTKRKIRSITILYGNRTPETIAYHIELRKLQAKLPLDIIHIFSHLSDDHPWIGYRGFVTKEIIEKETNLKKKPTFFIVGPPIFIEKMQDILAQLRVSESYIKRELLTITTSK